MADSPKLLLTFDLLTRSIKGIYGGSQIYVIPAIQIRHGCVNNLQVQSLQPINTYPDKHASDEDFCFMIDLFTHL